MTTSTPTSLKVNDMNYDTCHHKVFQYNLQSCNIQYLNEKYIHQVAFTSKQNMELFYITFASVHTHLGSQTCNKVSNNM